MKRIKSWLTDFIILSTYFILLLEISLSSLIFVAVPIIILFGLVKIFF